MVACSQILANKYALYLDIMAGGHKEACAPPFFLCCASRRARPVDVALRTRLTLCMPFHSEAFTQLKLKRYCCRRMVRGARTPAARRRRPPDAMPVAVPSSLPARGARLQVLTHVDLIEQLMNYNRAAPTPLLPSPPPPAQSLQCERRRSHPASTRLCVAALEGADAAVDGV